MENCVSCGGRLPEDINAHDDALTAGGDCPGQINDSGGCGAWDSFNDEQAALDAREDALDSASSLTDLLDAMRAEDDGDAVDWTSLPTFGGPDVADTVGVWSWDATHQIEGTCADDVVIVVRPDVALAIAVALLDADPCGDGEYRYRDGGTRTDWIVDESDMIDLGVALIEKRRDAYSLWCAETEGREVLRGC